MTLVETVSGVTSTTTFLVVPASLRECASTNAPAMEPPSVLYPDQAQKGTDLVGRYRLEEAVLG